MSRTLRALYLSVLCLSGIPVPQPAPAADFQLRKPEDEIIYFLLPDRFENGDPGNDRGGLRGGRLRTGFDPTDKHFFHGGDLQGLTQRLDYIEALGATAIWLGPIFTNKRVQGAPGEQTAGYHGYWITDFTQVDPHFGTRQELKTFVDAAHARGMKVYLDIITNHTADVIAYRECAAGPCPYRSRADYPYTMRGGLDGEPINAGFQGDSVHTAGNFAKLTRSDFAYTPYVPPAEAQLKVPGWLNDPIWYHNRGNTTFTGESLTMADYAGLDDLMTENPRVVQGFIDIYGAWLDEFRFDGFRVDTARHVNPEFWQVFAPAILERAQQRGIANFHLFAELWTGETDTARLARATRVDKLPSVIDFALRAALLRTVGANAATEELARIFADDALYEGGAEGALRLPTFVSNHDNGRFAYHVRKALPEASDDEVLARTILAHAMIFLLRGVPVVYSGDEQGFVGDGDDKDGREDMFASRVAEFNDNDLVATTATTAQSNFDRDHPIFRAIAELATLRRQHEALRRGQQVVRNAQRQPGLFAASRIDPRSGREILIAFNTSTAPLSANVEIDSRTTAFAALHGTCAPRPSAPGSYRVTLAPLSFIVCTARDPT